jgi:AraC family transcriptional regulator, dual regulator of chb operon
LTVYLFYIDIILDSISRRRIVRLTLSRFLSHPAHEYASLISNPRQLVISHSHDYYELFLVNHGKAVHQVNGGTQALVKGTVVFIRPDDTHAYLEPSVDFEIINMLIPPEAISDLFAYLGPGFGSDRFLKPKLPPLERLSINQHAAVVGEIEKLVLCRRIQPSAAEGLFRVALVNLLSSCFPVVAEHGSANVPLWLRWLALEMMKKENFTEGVSAMQRLSGRSNEHLARSCRRFLGKSPTELVNELRLVYATHALVTDDEPIIGISADAGFDSLSHFYHLFKKSYGMAPADYRRTARGDDGAGGYDIGLPVSPGIPVGIALPND